MPHEKFPELAGARQRLVARLKARVAIELGYSRPLDVHTWSEHPEVNTFVDRIYEACFRGGKPNIKKKHLKVVLLDLYLAWCQDPPP
jgi:hypothetical protein